MYFPYLRGRQYELLALKELATKKLITSSVIPVIEPIKIIPALNNSLAAFSNSCLPVGLILNPNVGDLADGADTINLLLDNYCLKQEQIIPSLIVNESTQIALDRLHERRIENDSILTFLGSRDYIDVYKGLFDISYPRFTLCPYEKSIRRNVKQHRVIFENRFKKRNRNVDYLKQEDEIFSDDHLGYKEENDIGFGDYSIVGEEYNEAGFAPYAVAIHIVYFAKDATLRIRHFVSESNDDISDVAGKFYEAFQSCMTGTLMETKNN